MKGKKPRGVWIRKCHRCGKIMFTLARTGKCCNRCNKKGLKLFEVKKSWIYEGISPKEMRIRLDMIKKCGLNGKQGKRKV